MSEAFQLQAGPYTLHLQGKTHVMGILNCTPDSFSDGGKYKTIDQAIDYMAVLMDQGADIIDIGGESTRPGSSPVSLDEELERVIPVLEAIKGRFPVPLSIDTYKSEVAKIAVGYGAHIINDVWSGKRDPLMASVAAHLDVPVILMQNSEQAQDDHLMEAIRSDLESRIRLFMDAGVAPRRIIVDPGIGFGLANTPQASLLVMNQLQEFADLGFPLLIGSSRKRFIGHVLDRSAHDRLEGTIATVCMAITKGCHIVRVHDVGQIVPAVRMMDAMLGKRSLIHER